MSLCRRAALCRDNGLLSDRVLCVPAQDFTLETKQTVSSFTFSEAKLGASFKEEL